MPRQEVVQVFRQYLGRDPNPNEYQGFSQMLDAGTLDPMGLALFVQSSSEFQRRQLPQLARDYAGALREGDSTYVQGQLGRAYDTADQRFARLGRTNSSGLGSAYAQAAGQIVGDLGRERQAGLQQLLQGYYGNMQQSQLGYGQAAWNRGYQLQDIYRQRDWDVQDWYRQAAHERDLLRRGKRDMKSRALWGIGGSLAGAAIGGFAGGPQGAATGAQIGSNLAYFGG